MVSIYPSLIAADPLNLEKTLKLLDPAVDGYHIDVMDDHFVPNLTWGPLVINALAQATNKQLWVHLMVDNPEAWLDRLTLPTQSIASIHIESTKEITNILTRIREKNWKPSLAISPKTAPEQTFDFLHLVDQVLIMSVEPGFSGQQFLPSSLDKIEPILEYRRSHDLNFSLAFDGGITEKNIGELISRGVTEFAIASTIFKSNDPIATIKKLKTIS